MRTLTTLVAIPFLSMAGSQLTTTANQPSCLTIALREAVSCDWDDGHVSKTYTSPCLITRFPARLLFASFERLISKTLSYSASLLKRELRHVHEGKDAYKNPCTRRAMSFERFARRGAVWEGRDALEAATRGMAVKDGD